MQLGPAKNKKSSLILVNQTLNTLLDVKFCLDGIYFIGINWMYLVFVDKTFILYSLIYLC